MKTKHMARVEIKDEERGEVTAVFSTFDVIDSDKDVTRPGAFTDGAAVRISAYGHESWFGALPVGKGNIHLTKNEAILDGRFFLQTAAGRETFTVVKEMAELQEWSYGYDPVKFSFGEFEGQQVRFLEQVDVHEVSPVLKGAGVDTRTLAVKGKQLNSDLRQQLTAVGRERFGGEETWVWLRDFDLDESYAIFEVETDDALQLQRVEFTREDDVLTLVDGATEVMPVTSYAPKGQRFNEQAQAVLAELSKLTDRAAEVKVLRAQKGKTLSTATIDLVGSIDVQLKRLAEVLAAQPVSDHRDDLAREFARYVALTQGVA